jgi:hypothetical protein
MPTIINNPPSTGGTESSALVLILSIAVAAGLIVLFFVYGLPAIRGTADAPKNDTVNVNVTSPLTADSSNPEASK